MWILLFITHFFILLGRQQEYYKIKRKLYEDRRREEIQHLPTTRVVPITAARTERALSPSPGSECPPQDAKLRWWTNPWEVVDSSKPWYMWSILPTPVCNSLDLMLLFFWTWPILAGTYPEYAMDRRGEPPEEITRGHNYVPLYVSAAIPYVHHLYSVISKFIIIIGILQGNLITTMPLCSCFRQ